MCRGWLGVAHDFGEVNETGPSGALGILFGEMCQIGNKRTLLANSVLLAAPRVYSLRWEVIRSGHL
jgi:hypothetical protein